MPLRPFPFEDFQGKGLPAVLPTLFFNFVKHGMVGRKKGQLELVKAQFKEAGAFRGFVEIVPLHPGVGEGGDLIILKAEEPVVFGDYRRLGVGIGKVDFCKALADDGDAQSKHSFVQSLCAMPGQYGRQGMTWERFPDEMTGPPPRKRVLNWRRRFPAAC
jgi:hypothetical protein